MQAIAKVNRVFKDAGWLIVDILVLRTLRSIGYHTASGERYSTLDQEEAVMTMLEKFEIVEQMYDKFDYKRYFSADTRQKLTIILEAQNYILGLEDGKNRYTVVTLCLKLLHCLFRT
jgi:type I restriction enzyme R subunit